MEYNGTAYPTTRALEISVSESESSYSAEIVMEYSLPEQLFGSQAGNVQQLNNDNLIRQISLDASYWLNEFDLDGLFNNVNHSLSHKFSRYYNRSVRTVNGKDIFQSIKFSDSFESTSVFINPGEFKSELNFPLYLRARDHFSGVNSNFIELNNMITDNLNTYKTINLLGTFTSIDNEARFISVADGQVAYTDEASSNFPDKIVNPASYEKLFMFMIMNNSLPGIPILFHGDEYGQIGIGGADSKRDLKFQNKLNLLESKLKNKISRLNSTRKQYPSLSIGDFFVLRESLNYSVWLKSYFGEHTIIFFNLQDKTIKLNIPLPFESKKLISLLDDKIIQLDNSKMASIVIPPYQSGIFLLDLK